MGSSKNDGSNNNVSFAAPRPFGKKLKSDLKETFFPDDPFLHFEDDKLLQRVKKGIQYFVPILEWLPKYNLNMFKYDLLAGITITSLAIPQGISYARLGSLPPIIGLYSSFIPPLIYAVLGSSKHLAVGTVAACSLLIAEIIGKVASPEKEPALYLHLVYTATFITGIFQFALGFLRLGILVDFLSHSTIIGFMGGTAVIICLQQLKGIFGLTHFTSKTDVYSVLHAIISLRKEWRWQSAVVGIIFLVFLQFTRYLRNRNPKLFWVSAMAPMVTVIVGCLFAYFIHGSQHGILTVGHLSKGINPISIHLLNFNSRYLSAVVQTGAITGLVALAEGIAIGRSFAIMKNEQIDGNKEMVAFGLMNIVGSLTSCYLTTGPFSKTAVNFNAGCRTAMSNVVMAIFMALTLLFLAPLFSYTPLVALSAIIMSAMFGLIKYEEIYHLFKVDKFDFCICMAAFLGVALLSMDVGIMLSVGLALLRALLYMARPATCKLGKIPDTSFYRDVEQYPDATRVPGIIVLQLGSPIYYANSNYIRESLPANMTPVQFLRFFNRIFRWVRDEQPPPDCKGTVQHVLLELSGVTSIDMTGIETLIEIRRSLQATGIQMGIVNPRIVVMEKLIASEFTNTIGKENIYLSVDEGVERCISVSAQKAKQTDDSDRSTDVTAMEQQV